MIYVIRTLALTLVEVLCCRIFFDIFLKRRPIKNRLDLIVMLLMWGAGFGVACISNFAFRSVAAITVFFIGMMFLYYGSWIQVFFLAIAEYALNLLVDCCIHLLLQYALQVEKHELWISTRSSMLIPVLSKMILVLIIMLFYRAFNSIGDIGILEKKEWIRFLLFPILAIVLAITMFTLQDDMAIMISSAGLLFADFLFFYLVRDIVKQEKRIQETHLIEAQTKNQILLYQTMESNYEEQQKKVHDFKNHMSCIQGLLEDGKQEKALDYISNLYGTWQKETIGLNTNHAIVNSILRQKYQYAQQTGVNMILNVGDLSELSMKDEDIVILLTNLLDNGIDTCKQLKEKPKELKICICIEQGEIRISTQNPVEEEPIMEKKRFVTSKSNKREHGIGMINIQRVVEKYQGEDFVQCKNGLFTHTIVIQLD
ncbi:MAG: GHKL domain-containing protein [Lachnospiraceae bacterium]|nr:GHKL domain-containing protein [Lachnospiraceae bacterium]